MVLEYSSRLGSFESLHWFPFVFKFCLSLLSCHHIFFIQFLMCIIRPVFQSLVVGYYLHTTIAKLLLFVFLD